MISSAGLVTLRWSSPRSARRASRCSRRSRWNPHGGHDGPDGRKRAVKRPEKTWRKCECSWVCHSLSICFWVEVVDITNKTQFFECLLWCVLWCDGCTTRNIWGNSGWWHRISEPKTAGMGDSGIRIWIYLTMQLKKWCTMVCPLVAVVSIRKLMFKHYFQTNSSSNVQFLPGKPIWLSEHDDIFSVPSLTRGDYKHIFQGATNDHLMWLKE